MTAGYSASPDRRPALGGLLAATSFLLQPLYAIPIQSFREALCPLLAKLLTPRGLGLAAPYYIRLFAKELKGLDELALGLGIDRSGPEWVEEKEVASILEQYDRLVGQLGVLALAPHDRRGRTTQFPAHLPAPVRVQLKHLHDLLRSVGPDNHIQEVVSDLKEALRSCDTSDSAIPAAEWQLTLSLLATAYAWLSAGPAYSFSEDDRKNVAAAYGLLSASSKTDDEAIVAGVACLYGVILLHFLCWVSLSGKQDARDSSGSLVGLFCPALGAHPAMFGTTEQAQQELDESRAVPGIQDIMGAFLLSVVLIKTSPSPGVAVTSETLLDALASVSRDVLVSLGFSMYEAIASTLAQRRHAEADEEAGLDLDTLHHTLPPFFLSHRNAILAVTEQLMGACQWQKARKWLALFRRCETLRLPTLGLLRELEQSVAEQGEQDGENVIPRGHLSAELGAAVDELVKAMRDQDDAILRGLNQQTRLAARLETTIDVHFKGSAERASYLSDCCAQFVSGAARSAAMPEESAFQLDVALGELHDEFGFLLFLGILYGAEPPYWSALKAGIEAAGARIYTQAAGGVSDELESGIPLLDLLGFEGTDDYLRCAGAACDRVSGILHGDPAPGVAGDLSAAVQQISRFSGLPGAAALSLALGSTYLAEGRRRYKEGKTYELQRQTQEALTSYSLAIGSFTKALTSPALDLVDLGWLRLAQLREAHAATGRFLGRLALRNVVESLAKAVQDGTAEGWLFAGTSNQFIEAREELSRECDEALTLADARARTAGRDRRRRRQASALLLCLAAAVGVVANRGTRGWLAPVTLSEVLIDVAGTASLSLLLWRIFTSPSEP